MNIDVKSLSLPKKKWLEEIAIRAHLTLAPNGTFTMAGLSAYSPLSHMMSEARSASCIENSRYMLPLLGAFAALDQLGECYTNPSKMLVGGNLTKSPIQKTLHYFKDIQISSVDSDALYGLRNGLTHSARLISVGQTHNSKHFWFQSKDLGEKLFEHPATPWNGVYNSRNNTNVTKVNSQLIVKLVEDMLLDMRNNIGTTNLKLALPSGLKELVENYVFINFDTTLDDSYDFCVTNGLI